MLFYWWVFAAIGSVLATAGAILLVAKVILPRLRRNRLEQDLRRGRDAFHRRREWLEARFLSMASRSGKPRGLQWVDCEFDDDVAFARDRHTGRLRALVGMTVQFAPIEGGGMEAVEAVQNRKAATVVFRLDGPDWEVDGRALFNLNPAETIAHYPHELETAE